MNGRRLGRPHRDGNGCWTEHLVIDGQEVIVHHDDLPLHDRTTVRGIPCTTAVRTVIDIAPEVTPGELDLVLADGLDRGLFTVDELVARLAEADMAHRPGALRVCEALARLLG